MEYSLIPNDIDILIEALDSWISNENMSFALTSLFIALIARNKEEFDNQIKQLKEKENTENMKDRIAEKKEIATLLKAKLILMKQQTINKDEHINSFGKTLKQKEI